MVDGVAKVRLTLLVSKVLAEVDGTGIERIAGIDIHAGHIAEHDGAQVDSVVVSLDHVQPQHIGVGGHAVGIKLHSGGVLTSVDVDGSVGVGDVLVEGIAIGGALLGGNPSVGVVVAVPSEVAADVVVLVGDGTTGDIEGHMVGAVATLGVGALIEHVEGVGQTAVGLINVSVVVTVVIGAGLVANHGEVVLGSVVNSQSQGLGSSAAVSIGDVAGVAAAGSVNGIVVGNPSVALASRIGNLGILMLVDGQHESLGGGAAVGIGDVAGVAAAGGVLGVVVVSPGVGVASGCTDLVILMLVNSQHQGLGSGATVGIGDVAGVVATLGVDSVVVVSPGVGVASGCTDLVILMVVDRQSQRNSAVATLGVDSFEGVITTHGVGLAITGAPSVAVASIVNSDSLNSVVVDGVVDVVENAVDGLGVVGGIGSQGNAEGSSIRQLVFADDDGLLHGEVQHKDTVASTRLGGIIVDTLDRGGVLNIVVPSVRSIGNHIDILHHARREDVVNAGNTVATTNSITGLLIEGLALTVSNTLVGVLTAGIDVDNTDNSIGNGQVQVGSTVATINSLSVEGVVTAGGVGVDGVSAVHPGIGVAVLGLDILNANRVHSVGDGHNAVATILGGPISLNRVAVNGLVEGTGDGELDSLVGIVGVGISNGVVGELILAVGQRGYDTVNGVHREDNGLDRVAIGIVNEGIPIDGLVHAELIVSHIVHHTVAVGPAIILAEGDRGNLLGGILGSEAEYLDKLATGSGKKLLREDGVFDNLVREALTGIPSVRHTSGHRHGLVLRTVDGKVDTRNLVAAGSGIAGTDDDTVVALVIVGADSLTIAGNRVDIPAVALLNGSPVEGIGDIVHHEVQAEDAVATVGGGHSRISRGEVPGDVILGIDVALVGQAIAFAPHKDSVAALAVEDHGILFVVDGEVQGHHRVATEGIGTGQCVLGGGVALGIDVVVERPLVAVAGHLGVNTGVLVVDGEVHRHHTVATLGGSQGNAGSGIGSVGLVVQRPSIAVASHLVEGRSLDGVDGEDQVILGRAVEDVVVGIDVAHTELIGERGALLDGGVGRRAPSDVGVLADLAVGIVDRHLLEGKGQVHQAVATVDGLEGVVVVAILGDVHSSLSAGLPGVRIGEVADALGIVQFIDRVDGDVVGGELVHAAVGVGHGHGVVAGDGSGDGGLSGGGVGVPAVAVAVDAGSRQANHVVLADDSGSGGNRNHGKLVHGDGDGSRLHLAVALGHHIVVGGLGGVHREGGTRTGHSGGSSIGIVPTEVHTLDVVGIGNGEHSAVLADADSLAVGGNGQHGHRRGGDGQRGRLKADTAGHRVGGAQGVHIRGGAQRVHSAGGSGAGILPHIGGIVNDAGALDGAGRQDQVEAFAVAINSIVYIIINKGYRGGVHVEVHMHQRVGSTGSGQVDILLDRGGIVMSLGTRTHSVGSTLAELVGEGHLVGGIEGEVQVTVDTVAVADIQHGVVVGAHQGFHLFTQRGALEGTIGVLMVLRSGPGVGTGIDGLHHRIGVGDDSRAEVGNRGSEVEHVGIVVQEHHGHRTVDSPVGAGGVGEGGLGDGLGGQGLSGLGGAGVTHAMVEAHAGLVGHGSEVITVGEVHHPASLGGILVDAEAHVLGIGGITIGHGKEGEGVVGIGGEGDVVAVGVDVGGHDLRTSLDRVGLHTGIARVARPGEGGAGGGDVGSRQVGGLKGVTHNRDVVNCSRRIGTARAVVRPHHHQVVIASCGNFLKALDALPGGLNIQFAIGKVNPSFGSNSTVVVRSNCGVLGVHIGDKVNVRRSQPHAEVVIVTFAIGLPVEAEVVPASLADVKQTISIRPLNATDVIGILSTIVIRDVEALLAAIIGSGAEVPTIVIVIDHGPIAVVGGLEAGNIRQGSRNLQGSDGDRNSGLARSCTARTNLEGIFCVGGKTADSSIGGTYLCRLCAVGDGVGDSGAGAEDIPVEVDAVGRHVAGSDTKHGGYFLNADIVDTAMDSGVTRGTSSVVSTRELESQTGICRSRSGQFIQIQLDTLSCGHSIPRLHGLEGGEVIIGDITKFKDCSSTCSTVSRTHLIVERNLNVIQWQVEERHSGNLDTTTLGTIIDIGGVGHIGTGELYRHIEILVVGHHGAVGSTRGYTDTTIIAASAVGEGRVGTIGIVEPAMGHDRGTIVGIRSAGKTSVFAEVLGIRQRSDGRTGGACIYCRHRGVASEAVGLHTEDVGSVGSQTSHSVGSGVDTGSDG